MFAYRRKIAKKLQYDERGKPIQRRMLKSLKWGVPKGVCVHCNEPLELKYSELDRKEAINGYMQENTELVHDKCHRARQAARSYT